MSGGTISVLFIKAVSAICKINQSFAVLFGPRLLDLKVGETFNVLIFPISLELIYT
jgi:hypothetical protein